MLVKQGFPLHGRGVVGQLRDPFLSKELSRVITSHGAVIRNMRDGSTEVNILCIHVHEETTHVPNRAEKSSYSKITHVLAGSVCRWLSQFQPGLWSSVGS